jgi:hypothetical protein
MAYLIPAQLAAVRKNKCGTTAATAATCPKLPQLPQSTPLGGDRHNDCGIPVGDSEADLHREGRCPNFWELPPVPIRPVSIVVGLPVFGCVKVRWCHRWSAAAILYFRAADSRASRT